MEDELAPLEPQPELVLQPQQLAELAGHVVVKELEAPTPGLLGGVHRNVGVADEILTPRPASGVEGDADARTDAQLAARDPDRLGERAQEASRDRACLRLVGPVEEDGELVSSEPRQRVAGAKLRVEPLGDDLEQLVAGVVAEAVVHLLEAVEVDQQDCENA
jgi:hypothetical protein